ncbi:extracellular solute-binding protein family 5 [Planktothrix agardhii CCAP 1459/11A]|jgi:peptide/nickel transport system substrate-binding protein|uniref:Extracellular solute-binding protein family 5 n=1 Tax=Planktothrix agardhii CCAP 1459/11A TaxID=282420 RepID=A0A4P5ZH95_PLAAG|nr:ABC transporter substrate-binding protein [Planktothrix agardhii]MCF3608691.1 ABC transporter substrate-binding protein [Planktothrix agardhii 1033]BBD57024.1 extracellular solute-binding protein family 5 [Planktothrix agardhii NIES-204]MCB8753354.1 ABC transporter substrate-binding protein [Planktothrix agardhii 1810]MCB8761913.1 ABC transporter substrate-binding protein [Planktothrix agardhii 1813]MCF3568894.1 ABC transporter substrate-binding protein [Planktothrix agardhii 1807]
MYLSQVERIWQQWQWIGWRKLLLGIMVIMIAIQGCNSTLFTTSEAQIPRLVSSERNDPETFNPVTSLDPHAVLGLIYEGMITQNGETGELEPGIAESWQISDDRQRLIFTLRPDVKWSDGEPLTADDVVFSFNEIYFNKNIPNNVRDILRIGQKGQFPKVRKVNDYQVEFITPEPFAPFLRYVGDVNLLPKHALKDTVNITNGKKKTQFLSIWGTDTPLEKIITNGPYRLLSFQPGERIILERNPYYWRKDNQGKTQPYIERIVIPIVGSTDNALMQFRAGGLDMVNITPDFFALMKREEKRGNFTVYNGGPAAVTHFITFNLNQATRKGKPVVDPIKSRWFNTLEFRQAIALSIDRTTMINNIFQGLGTPHDSPIYKQSPYYISPKEGLPVYNYDPNRAKKLLLQAGFKYNSQGKLEDADGNLVRFNLITSSDNSIRTQIAVQIIRDLANIGITVDFQLLAFNTLMTKLSKTLDWDAHILYFIGGNIEPDSTRNIWSVNGILHTFNQNTFYGVPLKGRIVQDWEQKISDLYIQGSQELNEDKRRKIYAQAQVLAQEYLPFIHLVNPLSFSAIRNDIKNIRFSGLSWRLWNVYELKIERSS